jgi:hypothetical protein
VTQGKNCELRPTTHLIFGIFVGTFLAPILCRATMLRLKRAQQRVLVAHLPELANIAVGSLLYSS